MTAAETTATGLTDLFGEPIDVYSRADALADGVLVAADPTLTALPVAYTRAVHTDCIAWDGATAAAKPETLQDPTGREWDVLTMLRHGMNRHQTETQFAFQVMRVPAAGRGLQPRLVTLKAQVGVGDAGEPVITVMLPTED